MHSCEEIVVLDFETTGLTPQSARVIEVGAAIVCSGQVIKTYGSLVDAGTPIPPFITQLTGISGDMLIGQPSSQQVMSELREFVGSRVILAHNAGFDSKFYYAEMGRHQISADNSFLCSLKLSRRLLAEAPNHRLGTLAQHLGIQVERAHRALDDVLVTAQVWAHLWQKVMERTGGLVPDFAFLSELSSRPAKRIDRFIERWSEQQQVSL